MKFKKSDIKVGNYVSLGNMPWFMSAYYRGEDKRTLDDMKRETIELYKNLLKKPASQRELSAHELKRNLKQLNGVYYQKVVSVKQMKVLYKPLGCKEVFKLKWITDVCADYKEVMFKGGCR